ncbi:MAG: sulfatase-like hydrolase/transferase [Planctomycetaceae bacterium]|jgi:arylsulfatase A-like enzyme|nr:sulfatase-like hydrolase/transferase [Planctomycetaceae bacterium]MBT4725314.1 sulfatase-like hydrolase/transferase [Planctomycetaceae bacterium]MBT5123269.1 sulfatase-like hydrolase/transferase [Planctomycetaceae bacterium]MBT5600087.1 sulfatase-like hydrolase/transferase [Planctomycetaceae bacterium]MBT5883414.1 sulfatase-like hydrolase/transferase [Planctomycetaceae bacterium]
MIRNFWLPCIVVVQLVPLLQAANPQPNIILLISDDQRSDTIAALGNDTIQTPNLDSLVKLGTSFTRATCGNPLCVPARAELLSGQTGFRNGVHPPNNKPDLTHTTLAQALTNGGYNTYWVGKWMIAGRPSTRGFQESLGLFASGKRPAQPQYDAAGRVVTGYRGWMFQTDDRQLFPEQGVGLTPDIESKFADAAIEFISRKSTKPYFLQVNFTAPHDPLLNPPDWDDTYTAKDMPLPENFRAKHPFDHGNFSGRDEMLNPWPRKKKDIQRDLVTYYRVISYMDQQIGRILDALKQTDPELNNTIIIFTSDHGLAIGSHGLMGKQNMYEHTIGIPLLFTGVNIPRGEQRSAQCYLRDLYPTICELADVEVLPAVEATSLMPILRNELKEVYPFIIGYYHDQQRMIRMQNWKYIYYPKANREQLFHLSADPHEMRDLSNSKRATRVKEQLREEMIVWLQNHGDSMFSAVNSDE